MTTCCDYLSSTCQIRSRSWNAIKIKIKVSYVSGHMTQTEWIRSCLCPLVETVRTSYFGSDGFECRLETNYLESFHGICISIFW